MTWLSRTLLSSGVLLVGATLSACGNSTTEDGGTPEMDRSVDLEARDFDATSLVGQSGAFCQLPEIDLGDFVPLDKQLFLDTLGDYAVGWMQPLHENLLAIDEQKFLEVFAEAIVGTYDERCREVPDYEFLPPDDDLLDPEVQSDVRETVTSWFEDAVVVPTEDGSLRLEIHECEDCGEPIGAVPSYLVARLTADGVLALEYELEAGNLWSKTLYVTPEAVVVQGRLDPLSTWSDTLNDDVRSGSTVLPNATGTITALFRKQGTDGMSAEIGVQEFDFVASPGQDTESHLRSSSECVGIVAQIDRATGSGDIGIYAGTLDLSLPGSVHCPNEPCGEQERTGSFDYHTDDLSVTLRDPESTVDAATDVGVHMGGFQTAAVAGKKFGEAGLSDEGNGAFSVAFTDTAGGVLAVFTPALDLRAALIISSFSDSYRLDLPSWLQDEVFDITFGDDPQPSVLVPRRELCETNPPEPLRREVRLERGKLRGTVGAGRDVSADAVSCVGETLAEDSTVQLTSDWVDVGFACE